jgi:hypothetical protein
MPFNRLNHSVLGEIRPRFTLKIECEPSVAIEHLKKKIIEDNTVSSLRANHTNNYVFLNTPTWLQHYWSPEMTVRIEKSEITNQTFVYCLIGPRQSVWAMFALLYAVICILTMFSSIFAFVKQQTSGELIYLWCIPVGVVLWSSVFITSKIGQSKGRDQMLHLVSFLYHSLEEITTIKRVEK